MTRALIKEGLKDVEAEIKKAKAYFKRTKDLKVEITSKQYLSLLNFKRKMLKKVLDEGKKSEKK